MNKQVSRINPYLPIAVLIAITGVNNHVLHQRVVPDPATASIAFACPSPDGVYRHVAVVDKLACVLSNAFLLAMDDPISRVVLAEFLTLIAAIVVIAHIAANRSSASWPVKYGVLLCLMVGQLRGLATVWPLFCVFIVWRSSASARASFVPSGVSRALLPTIIVSFFIPVLPMIAPDMVSKDGLRKCLDLWQIFPIYTSILMAILGSYFYAISNRQLTASDAVISTTFIVSTTDFLVLCSMLAHGYAIYLYMHLGLSLQDFIPTLVMNNAAEVMRTFFLVDFLGCLVATWTLIFYDTTRFAGLGRASPLAAIVVAVVGTVVLGPGGAVAWAWSSVEKARLSALVADRKPERKA